MINSGGCINRCCCVSMFYKICKRLIIKKLEPYSVLLFLLLYIAVNPLYYPQELKVSLEEISQTSDIIFTGNVTNIISQYNKQGSMIFTEVTFNDIEVLHSNTRSVQRNSNSIKLRYASGQVDDINVSVSGMPVFSEGQKYLIFMLDDGRDYFNPIVGGNQGLYEIIKDNKSNDFYLLTLSGKAITGITSEGLILSKNNFSYIENGNAVYNYKTEKLVDLQNKQIPVSDDSSSGFIPYSDEQQNSNPISLKIFTDYLSDHLLKVIIEDRVIRLNRDNNRKFGTSEKKDLGMIGSPDFNFEEDDFIKINLSIFELWLAESPPPSFLLTQGPAASVAGLLFFMQQEAEAHQTYVLPDMIGMLY